MHEQELLEELDELEEQELEQQDDDQRLLEKSYVTAYKRLVSATIVSKLFNKVVTSEPLNSAACVIEGTVL